MDLEQRQMIGRYFNIIPEYFVYVKTSLKDFYWYCLEAPLPVGSDCCYSSGMPVISALGTINDITSMPQDYIHTYFERLKIIMKNPAQEESTINWENIRWI